MKYVAVLIGLAVAGQASASHPCVTCLPIKKAPVKSNNVVVKEFREKLTVIEKPVIVREAVSYLATITPSPTYNVTTTINAPPQQQTLQIVQPVLGLSVQQQANGYGHHQPQAASVPESELAAALRAINERLCKLEAANGKPAADPFAVKASAWETLASKSCVKCHADNVAARDGGKFVLTDTLTPAQRMKVIGVLAARSMPPQPNKHGLPPVTDAEANQAIAELSK